MTLRLAAFLLGDDPADLPAALERKGFDAVVCRGDCPDALVEAALEAGLDVLALVDDDDPDAARDRAEHLGAWMVWGEELEEGEQCVRVGDAHAAEELTAGGELPAGVLWVAADDQDPGEGEDAALADLVEGLLEVAFEGAIALRGEDPERFGALLEAAQGPLEEAGSWWGDGQED